MRPLSYIVLVYSFFMTASQSLSATLSLEGGSAAAGASVSLPLSLSASGGQISSVGWTLSYSSVDFSSITVLLGAGSAASKTVACNTSAAGQYTCIVSGLNDSLITDGVLATATLRVSPTTTAASSTISVTSPISSSPIGAAVPTSGNSAIVAIQNVTPSLIGMDCSPATVTVPGPVSCAVTISGGAPTGGLTISLGEASSGVTVTMPSSLTIPAGATQSTFSAQVTSAISSATVTLVAALNGVTKNTSFTATLPVTLPSSTIRLYAGNRPYTDPQGNLWSANPGFSGPGGTWSPGAVAIANTSAPTLYQTEAYGDILYQLSVPNGPYTVTLKFAELELSSAGQRTFDVLLNGRMVLQNFDIVANAGAPRTAIDKQFTVNVTNGLVQVQLQGTRYGAVVNAIQISSGASGTISAPTPSSSSLISVYAGNAAYTDPQGNFWSANPGFSGPGGTWSPGAVAIANTSAPTLYQTEAYGDILFQFSVSNGSHTVTLKFAELEVSSAGQRTFDVLLNGQMVLQNFDIVANAGAPRTAIDKQFTVNVTNGVLQIQFLGTKYGAVINAIQISSGGAAPSPTTTSSLVSVYAGSQTYTDPQGNVWSANPRFSGPGGAWSPGAVAIANTNAPTLYETEAYGDILFQFPVPNGSHTVTLKFAELEVSSAGQRTFDVLLNGRMVLQNFDIVANAGAPRTAIDKQFTVNVTNGVLQIQFLGTKYGAAVNAIQIQ